MGSLYLSIADFTGGLSLDALLRGALLGLGAAVPIGPVNVEIARRALRHGFVAGAMLGLGAVSVDVFYAFATSFSFTRWFSHPQIGQVLSVLGIAMLAYLGVLSLRGAMKDLRRDPLATHADGSTPPPAGQSPFRGYATGVLMTLLNPMTLAFWFTVVPNLAPTNAPGQLPWICAGVFVGTITWVLFFAGLLAFAGRWRRNWWLAVADGIGGAILLAFAAAGLLRCLRAFL